MGRGNVATTATTTSDATTTKGTTTTTPFVDPPHHLYFPSHPYLTFPRPPPAFSPLSQCQIITPFGHQLRNISPWYGHEHFGHDHFGDWPHKGSALSLGESNILKYGVTYPLRTGLENPDGQPFPESVEYCTVDSSPAMAPLFEEQTEKGGGNVFEEIFLSRGVCTVSVGPLGGVSRVKALYRPLDSYGTGAKVKSVVKTQFPQDIKEDNSDLTDTYYCMVENSGISLYADGKSESHVAYMAEFQIERVLAIPFGLLVVPVKPVPTEGNPECHDSKYVYVLTHPAKQVSRVWHKPSGNDFMEFDSSQEKLLGCENGICVFWNSYGHSGFSVKRIIRLKKQDIVESTTLNASIYYTNLHEQSASPFTPAGGSSMYSSIGTHPQKTSSIRMNRDVHYREGSSLNYWPSFSFDYSNNNMTNHGHGLATGFYPPHYCVYDDPEFYFRPLFQCHNSPNQMEDEPKKFQLVCQQSSENERVSVWFLIDNVLNMHSIDVVLGKELISYEIDNVLDFVVSDPKYGTFVLVTLTSDNNIINVGFLDDTSRVSVSSILTHSIDHKITSLDAFLYGDTLLCGLENSPKKAVVIFKNYHKYGLIAKCVNHFYSKLPSQVVTQIVSLYTISRSEKSWKREWSAFKNIIESIVTWLLNKGFESLREAFEEAIKEVMEELTATGSAHDYLIKVASLHDWLKCKRENRIQDISPDLNYDKCSVFRKFLQLMPVKNPSGPVFESLPLIMKLLLKETDTMSSILKLCECKVAGKLFDPVIDILISDVLRRNQEKVSFDWPESVISLMGREDYLIPPAPEISPPVRYNPFNVKEELSDETVDWTLFVLNLQIFAEDRRLEEVCKLLDAASPLIIDIEQKAEMSDHDFLEDQERHLLQMMQVTLSAPVGRAAFTLRSEVKAFANLTNVISIPRLCLTGKCSKRGTNIEVNDTDLTTSLWPTFHNAVAATIAVRFADQPADEWFAYNKAKTTEGAEQAGMILGFGLNGILTSMPSTLQHDYLSKENSFMSMAMLLGLGVNKAGSGDIATWKVISLHIGAMLPACTTELEIPKLASLVAPCALGILFMGTHHNHIAKVLLGEISKRYSPLSLFGGGNNNNSAPTTNTADTNGSIADREAHSLCAGFGLGFVNLGKGRARANGGGMDEDGFDGILRRFVVGGPKPSTGNQDDDELSQLGPTLPSLWEEYRCCHIEEGDNVNVDVATPSAIVAVALTYLKSGNEAVLKWLSPPNTIHLLDGVRPDILMLRSLAYMLVLKETPKVSVEWLQMVLMPRALREKAMTKTNEYHRIGYDCTNQAWASIVCGYCLGLGIRRAGTRDVATVKTIYHYINYMMEMAFPENNINAYFPKNFLESTLCSMMLSLSLLLAGSGDVATLRLLRYMQHKISGISVTSSNNSYGLEMCISMAIGILFLGGGRYSLCCDDRSIAVILASVFPKWPINANDNRYHLQALRHLYVLACQPRLLLPKPMPHGKAIYFEIEYKSGQLEKLKAPVLLPPFDLVKKITLVDKDFLPVTFVLPKDLPYLKRVVSNNGVITLVHKPVAMIEHNFLKHMAWREAKVFQNTLPIESKREIPVEEVLHEKELNLLCRLADAAGLRKILPALLAINDEDPKTMRWQLQLQILYSWINRSQKFCTSSSIPVELLGVLVNKADPKFYRIMFKNDSE